MFAQVCKLTHLSVNLMKTLNSKLQNPIKLQLYTPKKKVDFQ